MCSHRSLPFLQTVTRIKSYAKPTGKYPVKKKACATRAEGQGQGHTGVSVGAVGACAAHVDNFRVRRSVSPQIVASFLRDQISHNLQLWQIPTPSINPVYPSPTTAATPPCTHIFLLCPPPMPIERQRRVIYPGLEIYHRLALGHTRSWNVPG